MRNAVALHGLRRNFALLSVVMVAPERNNGVYAHMVQGLGYRPHKATQRYGTALRDEQAAGSSRGYVLRNARHPGLHRVRMHLVDEGALGVPQHPRHVERALASGATETG